VIRVRVPDLQPGFSVLRGVSGDTLSLISSSAEFDSRLRKIISGDGVVGLHGCLKHSKSWFNPRSLDQLEQSSRNFGPNNSRLCNSTGRALPQGRGRGFNPLRLERKSRVTREFSTLSKAVLGNGPIGRPAAFEAVHRVGSIPTSPANGFLTQLVRVSAF
jgi:hypothetical protein